MKKETLIPCDEPMLNDKDEAESEDKGMKSDNQEESAAALAALTAQAPKSHGSPKTRIKQ